MFYKPITKHEGTNVFYSTALAGGIESVADYPKLVEAVLRRGATDDQVRKLVGENILR